MVWKYIDEMPLIEVARAGYLVCAAAIDGMRYPADEWDEDKVRNLEDEFWRARLEGAAGSLAFMFAASKKFAGGEGIGIGDAVFAIQDNMCDAVCVMNDTDVDWEIRMAKADDLARESFLCFIHMIDSEMFDAMEAADKEDRLRVKGVEG